MYEVNAFIFGTRYSKLNVIMAGSGEVCCQVQWCQQISEKSQVIRHLSEDDGPQVFKYGLHLESASAALFL